MTRNSELFDRIVEHQGDVRLYEKQNVVFNRRIVKQHQANIRDLLKGNIRADLTREAVRFNRELKNSNIARINELAKEEVDFYTENLRKATSDYYKVSKPFYKDIDSNIRGSQIKNNKLLAANFDSISKSELSRVDAIVKRGLSEGKSNADIIRDVVRTTKLTEHQANTLARTAITSTQNSAIDLLMEKNKDILDGYVFTAVLDNRTSTICQNHDGQVYSVDDKQWRPPLHWNCRSSLVPILKSKEDLLKMESERLKKRGLNNVDPNDLAGDVPPKQNYGEWLKRQAYAVQLRVLGDEDRVSLFQEGRLQMKEFFNNIGKPISLARLYQRNAEVLSQNAKVKPLQKDVIPDDIVVNVLNRTDLIKDKEAQKALAAIILRDANDTKQSMSLMDYKGNTRAEKAASRRKANGFERADTDESLFFEDPTTGAVIHKYIHQPDFNLHKERQLLVERSKLLTGEEKEFIITFTGSLDGRVGLNQQTLVLESLRVMFERQYKDGLDFGNFKNYFRSTNNFYINDLGKRQKNIELEAAQRFFRNSNKVRILDDVTTVDELSANLYKIKREIETWEERVGKRLARKLLYSGKAPLNVYLRNFLRIDVPSIEPKKAIIKALNDAFPEFKKAYELYLKLKDLDPPDRWIKNFFRSKRERVRSLIDLEFANLSHRDKVAELFDKKLGQEQKVRLILDAIGTIANGEGGDLDSIAIRLGKLLDSRMVEINWKPFNEEITLSNARKLGLEFIDTLEKNRLIRVDSFGAQRRQVISLDDGQARGPLIDVQQGQIHILDKDLYELHKNKMKLYVARRFSTSRDRDRLYVRKGEKFYRDARGNRTEVSVITRSAAKRTDPKQIDNDVIDMLNYTNSVQYEADPDFAFFMDKMWKYEDQRGNAKHYRERNKFQQLVEKRGSSMYGTMKTLDYYRRTGKAYRNYAQLDGRFRLYYQGFLTPAGGETIRPFINFHKAVDMTPDALDELRMQLGTVVGDGDEILSYQGRRNAFKRFEKDILEIGGHLQNKTQVDRAIRAVLDNNNVFHHDAEEIPKFLRYCLEYKRIHDFTKGNPDNLELLSKYKTKLMVENDASASGFQMIGLLAKDKDIAENTNLVPTPAKQRIYDTIAKLTASDPRITEDPVLGQLGINWKDLQKAAKMHNMVFAYGAGEATQASNIAAKFGKFLEKQGFLVYGKGDLDNIKKRLMTAELEAEKLKMWEAVRELRALRKDLQYNIENHVDVSDVLARNVALIQDVDLIETVTRLTTTKAELFGPKDFARLARIMTDNLSEISAVPKKNNDFWKKAAKIFVNDTGSVDIPWVTFDGKVLRQRYIPRIQEKVEIQPALTYEYVDQATGEVKTGVSRKPIFAIFEDGTINEEFKFEHKASLTRASIGLGVNGNHMNDASIVRMFHLWSKRNQVSTATIHDGFAHNLGDVVRVKQALRDAYARAVAYESFKATLKQMRKEGLSKESYDELYALAKEYGLIDRDDPLTAEDILRDVPGKDYYAFGP